MAYFSNKKIEYKPLPIPDDPPYTPPTPPTPPDPETYPTPDIPRPQFDGTTQIMFLVCTDEREKINKTYETVATCTGVFQRPVDLINPEISIELPNDLTVCNYFYMLGRFYHIENMFLSNGQIYVIRGAVDVLSTYKTGILNCKCIVDRTSIERYSNKNLNDSEIISEQRHRQECIQFPEISTTNKFLRDPVQILVTVASPNAHEPNSEFLTNDHVYNAYINLCNLLNIPLDWYEQGGE